MKNDQEEILKRLDTIELMLLTLLDQNSGGSQAVIGSALTKANRLKALLNNMGL